MKEASRVLLTGGHGFTGRHLACVLASAGHVPIPLRSDLTARRDVLEEVASIKPQYVIHLGGISFAGGPYSSKIYDVNVAGTLNLLDALVESGRRPDRVLLASSASIYGNQETGIYSEALCPKPISHYGNSKLAMENMAQSYRDQLDIFVLRPFNYTGVGQSPEFVVPKLVAAFRHRKTSLRLGNLNVIREFNDVRDICRLYVRLLSASATSHPLNICSGRGIRLSDIIDDLGSRFSCSVSLAIDEDLVRKGEKEVIVGDPTRLNSLIEFNWEHSIGDTLEWFASVNI